MVQIAVCDDCQQQVEDVLALLSKYQAERPGVEICASSFVMGAGVLDRIKSGQEFDLFILDIMMPGLCGIELAQEIRALNEEAYIVFLTNSEDYALDAFNVQATQYMLKPVKEDSLFQTIDKIISVLWREKDSFLLVSTADRKVKVSFSSIIFVESVQRELQFHLADGSKLISKTLRVPFASAIAPLLQDIRFLYAHKSYVLNMSMVEQLTRNSFIMKNNIEIFIPRYKYSNAKSEYLDYLSAQGIGLLGGM